MMEVYDKNGKAIKLLSNDDVSIVTYEISGKIAASSTAELSAEFNEDVDNYRTYIISARIKSGSSNTLIYNYYTYNNIIAALCRNLNSIEVDVVIQILVLLIRR